MHFLRNAQRRWLTFWHWSSVTPYTSSCEFAGSCVFDKQSPGILSLRPPNLMRGRSYSEVTTAFLPSSLNYLHSFSLLFSSRPPVSVFGTVCFYLCLEVFLESGLCDLCLGEPKRRVYASGLLIKEKFVGFSSRSPSRSRPQSNKGRHILHSVHPSQ